MKSLEQHSKRYRRMHIALSFVGAVTAMTIFWTLLFICVSYASDRMHREDTKQQLLQDAQHAVQLLEAADVSAADNGDERRNKLLQALAEQENLSIAVADRSGQWAVFGPHAAAMVNRLGLQSAAASPSAQETRFIYRWANPFHARDAALAITVTGSDGERYQVAIGMPLPAWFSSYWHAIAPLLLFGLLMGIFSTIAAPWQKQFKQLQIMMDAMKRIASGDFSVKVFSTMRNRGEIGMIVEGLNDMASELQELEQTRQRFISDVSHELQSPLTSIAGFARALHHESLSAQTRTDYLNMIESESMRLSKLSDSLLKLTMLEARREPGEQTTFSLDLQLKRTVLALEPLWLAKKLDIDIDIQPLSITGDEDALRQVWTNLLHNAIKFTPEDGSIRIQLRKDDAAKQATIVISDTGIGVNETDLPHLFERFYKADQARSSAQGGSGLGLAIVATIVRQHGGEIRADSALGAGTTFTVMLPLGQSDRTAAPDA
ncbi:integral membrane sensor signal transduction histidine kinase [Paenibacillus curdlanolyticus YK9]|uniref:histidine kinase n=1 Tax=Paenibacillus curdlanolyticus YK9 TaxID=717606 RepID=E0IGK1_9BACL|nr:HAMP domain-containing sensor histidine kinase [Paenibacillus curdlanolyticus]EFM08405.1 integral membrane sensor signal transduction histidine kinase [Paenibacillus curdlanolyticus YK9]